MDKNSAIGFGLLVAILIGYFTYSNHQQTKYREQVHADSIAYAKTHPKAAIDTSKVTTEATAGTDSLLPQAFHGMAQEVVLENDKIAVTLNTKGGYPTAARVKGYKTYNKQDLYIFNGAGNSMSLVMPSDKGNVSTADLYFVPTVRKDANGGQSVEMTADMGNGRKVSFLYTLAKDNNMMDYQVKVSGASGTAIPLVWDMKGLSTEKDVYNQRLATQIYYHFQDDDNDYFTVNEEKNKTLDKPVKWLGYRQLYFSTILQSEEGFARTNIKSNTKFPDKDFVSKSSFTFDLPVKGGGEQLYRFHWYIGPNDHNTLKAYNAHFEDMVPYGYGIFTFVKYINKWFLLPLFTFLYSSVGNVAIVLVLMTIVIRLLLSFFTYKSYLSSAKMRVLKPELDELRERCGDDKQKMSMEQMKLYREAGVNPLGGCLPMLFQLPILLSLYYFIPTAIQIRQASFLWADDLSTYDAITTWSTQIPFLSSVYGNHISLFTLLMTLSSLFLALYNRNNTPQDPNNPMMKWMPFVFPIFLMGFFNKMAAALTFYYFVSNMLSILQQFIIQKFFIDEAKVHAQIQENKKKPAASSKWAERLAEIQKQQQGPKNIKK
ncbi:membrane protein insertase YidC [Rurimicrobium arvi]|uniref:Membrane protein insertase YidC n=1 Tax=Rurimicrobium arvi TaxID=2049916 RepID=A0ABP8MNE9_9BACT